MAIPPLQLTFDRSFWVFDRRVIRVRAFNTPRTYVEMFLGEDGALVNSQSQARVFEFVQQAQIEAIQLKSHIEGHNTDFIKIHCHTLKPTLCYDLNKIRERREREKAKAEA